MEISSRLLIYRVNRNTRIDDMGPFKGLALAIKSVQFLLANKLSTCIASQIQTDQY